MRLIARRHSLLGSKRLPPGFRRLPWIASTGSQFIRTGITQLDGTVTELSAQVTSVGSSDYWRAVLSVSTGYVGLLVGYVKGASAFGFGSGHNFSAADRFLQPFVLRMHWGTLGSSAESGGETISIPRTTAYSGGASIAIPSPVSSTQRPANLKIFRARNRVDGTLVQDLVPAERLSDGAGGLFDLVQGQFYPSEGTEAFVKGARA